MSLLPPNAWDAHIHLPPFPADHTDRSIPVSPHYNSGHIVQSSPAHNFTLTMSLSDTSVSPILSAIESLNGMNRRARATIMLDPKDMSVAKLRTLDAKGVRSVRVHVGKIVADYGATIESVERVLGMTSQAIHEAGLLWPVDAQLSLSTWAKLAGVLEDLHEQHGTTFVADHIFCADPSAADSPDLERALELVEKGIVYVKICGMAKYATGPEGMEGLIPVIREVLRCRGGEGAIWGSDWPHADLEGNTTKVDIQHQLMFLHGICAKEGEGYWEKLTRDNAERLYAR